MAAKFELLNGIEMYPFNGTIKFKNPVGLTFKNFHLIEKEKQTQSTLKVMLLQATEIA